MPRNDEDIAGETGLEFAKDVERNGSTRGKAGETIFLVIEALPSVVTEGLQKMATQPAFSSRQGDRSRRSTISRVISRSRTRLFEGK